MRTRHWAEIGEAGCIAGIWLLYGVHRYLGRTPFRLVLYPVVLYYWLRRPEARAGSREYLARLQARHGVFGRPPGIRLALGHFRAFAETLLDKALAFGGRFAFGTVRYEGDGDVLRALQGGRGGLFIASHLGNLELCRTLADLRPGLRLSVLVHTRHAPTFNRVLERLSPQAALKLIQVTDLNPGVAALLAERVAAGEFVVIAGDRVPVSVQPRVVWAPFLGKPAPFPVGPYVLAALLRCPVFLVFCVREGEGYRLVFESFRDQIVLPRARREQALRELAADYAARLERQCVKAPLEWCNFFPFWTQPGIEPHAQHGH